MTNRAYEMPFEPIDVTEHFNFLCGRAIECIWHAGLRGDAVGDIETAIELLQREILRIEAFEKD